MHATLSIALVKLQYGELKEQSIALGEGEDLKKTWNEHDITEAKNVNISPHLFVIVFGFSATLSGTSEQFCLH